MKLLKQLNQITEARRVPAGTFTEPKSKKSDQVTDFRHIEFDPANPYHADEKKRRDAEKAKQPKYTSAGLKAKAKKIAKQIFKDAEDAHEIGPSDLIDNYVDMRKDPTLWQAVMDILG